MTRVLTWRISMKPTDAGWRRRGSDSIAGSGRGAAGGGSGRRLGAGGGGGAAHEVVADGGGTWHRQPVEGDGGVLGTGGMNHELGEAEPAQQGALLDIGVLNAAARHDGDAAPEDAPVDFNTEAGDAVAGAAILQGRAQQGAAEHRRGEHGPGAEAEDTP